MSITKKRIMSYHATSLKKLSTGLLFVFPLFLPMVLRGFFGSINGIM